MESDLVNKTWVIFSVSSAFRCQLSPSFGFQGMCTGPDSMVSAWHTTTSCNTAHASYLFLPSWNFGSRPYFHLFVLLSILNIERTYSSSNPLSPKSIHASLSLGSSQTIASPPFTYLLCFYWFQFLSLYPGLFASQNFRILLSFISPHKCGVLLPILSQRWKREIEFLNIFENLLS